MPKTWKGQTPKAIKIERIKEKLSKDERRRVVLPTTKKGQADVWDAIGKAHGIDLQKVDYKLEDDTLIPVRLVL